MKQRVCTLRSLSNEPCELARLPVFSTVKRATYVARLIETWEYKEDFVLYKNMFEKFKKRTMETIENWKNKKQKPTKNIRNGPIKN